MIVQFAPPDDAAMRDKTSSKERMRTLLAYQIDRAQASMRKKPPSRAKYLHAIYDDVYSDASGWKGEVLQILMDGRSSMVELRSDIRTKEVMIVRREVAGVLRKRSWSYPMIGDFLDKDHTTAIALVNPERRKERYAKKQKYNQPTVRRVYLPLDFPPDDQGSVFGPDGWIDLPAGGGDATKG